MNYQREVDGGVKLKSERGLKPEVAGDNAPPSPPAPLYLLGK